MARRRRGLKLRTDERDLKIAIKKLRKRIPPHSACVQCGECCGPIILTPFELKAIVRILRINNLWPEVAKNMLRRDASEDGNVRMTCPLLRIETIDGQPMRPSIQMEWERVKNKTTSCMVYKERPIVCRLHGHIVPELMCPQGIPAKRFQKDKFYERYMDICAKTGTYMRESLMTVMEAAKNMHDNKGLDTTKPPEIKVEMREATPKEIASVTKKTFKQEEQKMGDEIDKQQEIEERMREKKVVTGDKVRDADKVVEDSKDKIVND